MWEILNGHDSPATLSEGGIKLTCSPVAFVEDYV